MKKRFSEERIIGILKEAEAGMGDGTTAGRSLVNMDAVASS
jgi:hypothetical protein